MRKPFKWVLRFRVQHTRMTNIYGHHSIGNGETLNIFKQGSGIISHALQEINLAASSGNTEWEKMETERTVRGRLLWPPRVSARKESHWEMNERHFGC